MSMDYKDDDSIIRPLSCRLRLKCDGTRAETRFRLSAKRTSPFKSAGTSVQSTTDSRCVRISGSNAGYTMFRGSVKSTGYPIHSTVSPSLPLPCVTVCHHISTGLYMTKPWPRHSSPSWPSFKVNFRRSTVWNCLLTVQRPQLTGWRNIADEGMGACRFLILMAPILFVSGHPCSWAQDTEVDVATCHWLQGSGFVPRWKKIIFLLHTTSDWPWKKPRLHYNKYGVSFPAVKGMERGGDHQPPSNALWVFMSC